MKSFTLEEIALACGGKFSGSESDKKTEITSVERDSRAVKNGSLFLAIKGERVDGHDYIEQCFQSGAACVVCEKPPLDCGKPYILVDSTLEAVKKIAKAYRQKFNIPIIGVSGSVGKTSTKEISVSVAVQSSATWNVTIRYLKLFNGSTLLALALNPTTRNVPLLLGRLLSMLEEEPIVIISGPYSPSITLEGVT